MFKKIIFEKEDGVAVVRLNRPEAMNALDMEIQEELAKAVEHVRTDEDIRVLIITGTGRAFCTGGDIRAMKEMTRDENTKHLKHMYRIIIDLVSMEKPVIAAVNGYAYGAGCNLALASDMIIASENATFSQGFVKFGLIPDLGGMYFLPRLIGLSKAKELMFVGETIDAREAEKIGMVNRVVPENELEKCVKEFAKKIATGSSQSIMLTKMILNKSSHLDFHTLLELELQAQEICSQTDEHKKAVQDFFETRKKTKKEV
jgi:2-(1,2-epoxy-1,2-dihydrophenyl)acetyl-CoA isomerase